MCYGPKIQKTILKKMIFTRTGNGSVLAELDMVFIDEDEVERDLTCKFIEGEFPEEARMSRELAKAMHFLGDQKLIEWNRKENEYDMSILAKRILDEMNRREPKGIWNKIKGSLSGFITYCRDL